MEIKHLVFFSLVLFSLSSVYAVETTLNANATGVFSSNSSRTFTDGGCSGITLAGGNEFGSEGYLAIGVSDNSRSYTYHSVNDAFVFMNFTLPEYSSLNWIYVSYEGQEGRASENVYLCQYDYNGGSWNSTGRTSSLTDHTETYNLTDNLADFVDGNRVYTFAYVLDYGASEVETDHVFITVSYTPTNVAPTIDETIEPTDPSSYSEGVDYVFYANITDTDGNLDSVNFTYGGTTYTVTNFENTTSTNWKYNYTLTDLEVQSNTAWKWCSNDTQGESVCNSTGSGFTINKGSGTLTGWMINDTYVSLNDSVLLQTNGTLLDTILAEIQTSDDTKNLTLTWDSTLKNYTYTITNSDLGDAAANATTINITKFYFGGNNHTATTNTSTLSFSYGLADISSSVSPASTSNAGNGSVTITVLYNTTEDNPIADNCSVLISATTYYFDYVAGVHNISLNTSGWAPASYNGAITCSNTSYETETDSVSFTVITSSPGGGGPTGGGGSGGILYTLTGNASVEIGPAILGILTRPGITRQTDITLCAINETLNFDVVLIGDDYVKDWFELPIKEDEKFVVEKGICKFFNINITIPVDTPPDEYEVGLRFIDLSNGIDEIVKIDIHVNRMLGTIVSFIRKLITKVSTPLVIKEDCGKNKVSINKDEICIYSPERKFEIPYFASGFMLFSTIVTAQIFKLMEKSIRNKQIRIFLLKNRWVKSLFIMSVIILILMVIP